jgi:hypothetical protein
MVTVGSGALSGPADVSCLASRIVAAAGDKRLRGHDREPQHPRGLLPCRRVFDWREDRTSYEITLDEVERIAVTPVISSR